MEKKISIAKSMPFTFAVVSGVNEQVKRNIKRFPSDFMFQLSKEEYQFFKSQNTTSSWGGRRSLPYAFTEHGNLWHNHNLQG